MSLRAVLLEANRSADYSSPALRGQMEEIDMQALGRIIERMAQRAIVLAHAYEVMQDGSCSHPLEAFLHATECPVINETPLPDSEFYALMPLWGRTCEACHHANTAKNVSPVGRSLPDDATESFVKRFMRGE